ncbi:MAG TPA: hypothetical protein VJ809_08845 [Pirellulales bacterium]|nr:hypothetical protein [Pirellulales bacterium]
MAQLNLSFIVDGGKTCTQIGVKSNVNRIRFTNKANKKLTVKFLQAGKIEKAGGGSLPNDTLELQAGDPPEILRFKNSAPGNSVKYTATIDGEQAEDPMIIID